MVHTVARSGIVVVWIFMMSIALVGKVAASDVTLYLPILQPLPWSEPREPKELQLIDRIEGIRLGGSGLGVPDTRHPALDTFGSSAYMLISPGEGGSLLAIVDSSAPANLRRIDLGYRADSLRLGDDRLYIVAGGPDVATSIHVYRAPVGATLEELGRLPVEAWPKKLVAEHSALYFTDDNKLFTIDSTDAAHPRVASTRKLGFRPLDIAATDDGMVYVLDEKRVVIVDGRDRSKPEVVGQLGPFDRPSSVRVSQDNGFLYVLDRQWVSAFVTDGQLSVFNLAQPATPKLTASVNLSGLFYGEDGVMNDFGPAFTTLDAKRMYVAADGLAVIDLTSQSRPQLEMQTPMPQRALGLGAAAGRLFVAEEDGSFAVFRVP